MDDDFLDRISDDPLTTTIEYYTSRLGENPKALEFLDRQCLSADATLRVGFSDRTIGKRLPSHHSKPGRELRKFLQNAGILKPTGHETFRGYVTVPLSSGDGAVTGVYGLRIDRNGGGDRIVRIGCGFFNAAALARFTEIIVCSTALDAWTFFAAGHQNVIALEDVEVKQADFQKTKRVLLADAAIGSEPFDDLAVLRLNFPDRTSVHQYAIENRQRADALGARVRAASWVSGAPEPVQIKITPPIASPTPKPVAELPVQQSDAEITISIDDRRWRIRGLDRNTMVGVLKVNVMVFNERADRFHVDTLDLYHARSRRVFLKEAAEEIGMNEDDLRSDLGRVLLRLEQLQQDQQSQRQTQTQQVELTDTERRDAMQLLTDQRLLDRILDDFEACGIVGERIGKLTGYLAATSRLLDKPLGIVIQSSSAAGKTSLMDAILGMMPAEQQFACSAMTSQSLYYAGNFDLRHKILSVAEDEGVRDASYALKLLQSDGKLSIVTTGRETGTGRTAVERYEVEGPVALLLTTTATDVDPELMNRCFVLCVDEHTRQTAAIQDRQRQAETLDSVLAETQAGRIRQLHQNAQRLLQPIKVVNRYADQLTFPTTRVRNRRDNAKYLTLIKAVALLHQHQREHKQQTVDDITVDYIEVERSDIIVANRIANHVFGNCIDDLPTQTRRLLGEIFKYVDAAADNKDRPISDLRFTRRELRGALNWGQTQIKVHLDRLANYEYVHVYAGIGRTLQYELNWDGRGNDGMPTLPGLADPDALQEPPRTTQSSSASNRQSSGPDQA